MRRPPEPAAGASGGEATGVGATGGAAGGGGLKGGGTKGDAGTTGRAGGHGIAGAASATAMAPSLCIASSATWMLSSFMILTLTRAVPLVSKPRSCAARRDTSMIRPFA